MRFPTVHMNGTSGEDLLNEYMQAVKSLEQALDALRAVTVHGRDYYVQSSDAASEAIAEHRARLAALENVQRDLRLIAVHVDTQVNERKRRAS